MGYLPSCCTLAPQSSVACLWPYSSISPAVLTSVDTFRPLSSSYFKSGHRSAHRYIPQTLCCCKQTLLEIMFCGFSAYSNRLHVNTICAFGHLSSFDVVSRGCCRGVHWNYRVHAYAHTHTPNTGHVVCKCIGLSLCTWACLILNVALYKYIHQRVHTCQCAQS